MSDEVVKKPDKRLNETLTTVSSGVVAIGTLVGWFFGSSRGFPPWFTYVLTGFVILLLYKYSEGTIRMIIQNLAVRSFIRDQHPKLVDFIQRFSELVTTRGDGSIAVALQKISERKGKDLVDRDLYSWPDQFISNILLRLSDAGKSISVGEFKGILNDLSSLIKFTSYFYFQKPMHLGDLGELTKDERKTLELVRENYADFVRRFGAFHDDVNGRFGSSTRAHYDIPKPVS
jgi:hypothetical protein